MGRKNDLSSLNDHLFAQMERLTDEDNTPEQLEIEIKRTAAVVSLSDQVINNARVVLSATKIAAEYGKIPDQFGVETKKLENK